MKIKATTLEAFAKEIHSPDLHQQVGSFRELESATLRWLRKYIKHVQAAKHVRHSRTKTGIGRITE